MAQTLRGGLRPDLTETETRAMRLRAQGLGAREAAARMRVSTHTFHYHMQSAYRRLGVSSLVDALRAIGWLWVPSEDDR